MLNCRKIQKRYCKLMLISIFSFLLGSMITVNFIPINKTCKLDKEDKEYNIMNNSKLKSPDLVIIILSAPKNLDRRNTIRETWLKFTANIKENDRNIMLVKHFFIIGSLGLSTNEEINLKTEQTTYNDILSLPIYDSYNNLTEKVAKSFSWLSGQLDIGFSFKYVLKCDDDSFVRIDNLIHELNHLQIIYIKSDVRTINPINDDSSPYIRANLQRNEYSSDKLRELYWGYFSGSAKIKTKGKWKETGWILCDHYLPYALGGGYVLSRNLVTYIGRNSEILRFHNSEDISVGAWLAPLNNIVRIHDIRFDTEWITRGCQNYHLISHNLSMDKMKEMYDNIVKLGYLCTTESIKRPRYLYNWLLPPSKCCNKNKDL